MENKDSLEELVRSIAKDKDAKKEQIEHKGSADAQKLDVSMNQDASREKAAKMEQIRAALSHDDTEDAASAAKPETVVTATPAAPVKPLKPLKPLKPISAENKPAAEKTAPEKSAPAEPEKDEAKAEKPAAAATPSAEKPVRPAAEKSAKSTSVKSGGKKSGKKKPGSKKNKHVAGPPALAQHGITYGMIAAAVGVGLAISTVAGYLIVAATYKEKFLPNTLVNGIEVDRMSVEQAEDTLIQKTDVKDLTLITHDGDQVVFKASDFGVKYSVPYGALDEAVSENPYNWVTKLFGETEYKVNYDLSYDEGKLRDLINNYDWGEDVSQNACIVRQDDGSFRIQEETLGDEFDTEVLLAYLREQMSSGMNTFTMEDSGCYEGYRAAVRASDLTQELDLYNSYARCNITYDFDDRKKVVTSDMIADWIMTYPDGTVLTDSEGKVQFDRSAVSTFVAQMAAETDTVGKPRHFYATLDGWIDVPWNGDNSSTYGWQINQEETTAQLIGLMQAGKTVTVEPEYSRKGYTRKTDDIGNTYVEADISAQHFWVYINGQMVLDDDFVSGTETNPSRRTPRGVCCILSRNTKVVLGTMAVQGYECPVDYWMPFNWLGCGFHDLSRGAYGGSIYMYNGSHGCLNLKWATAKALYETVETGMPVLIHD